MSREYLANKDISFVACRPQVYGCLEQRHAPDERHQGRVDVGVEEDEAEVREAVIFLQAISSEPFRYLTCIVADISMVENIDSPNVAADLEAT